MAEFEAKFSGLEAQFVLAYRKAQISKVLTDNFILYSSHTFSKLVRQCGQV
jgi:hypothetical protein